MSRWLALAIVGSMLVVPAAGAAGWTQAGSDAARTGTIPEPGPGLNETAFEVPLPGALHHLQWVGGGDVVAEPLIHEGAAYVPVVPSDDHESREARGIAEVDLETAQVELFTELEDEGAPWTGIAIVDGQLLVPGRSALEAYDLDTGEVAWAASLSGDNRFCQAPAVGEDLVVLACAGVGDTSQGIDPEIWAVEVETGEPVWNRMLTTTEEEREALGVGVEGSPEPTSWSLGVSFSGDLVYPITVETYQACVPAVVFSACTVPTTYTLWAVSTDSGEIRWKNSTDVGTGDGNEELGNDGAFPKLAPRVTATPRVVYPNIAGTLQYINPLQDEPQVNWARQIGGADAAPDRFIGPASALSDGTLYAASAQSVYRFDAETGAESWRVSVATDQELVSGSLVVADDTLYTLAHEKGFDHSQAYAFDAETGAPLWSQVFEPQGSEDSTRFSFALGDGVMVVAGTDATLRVIGSTAASLKPVVQVSTAYPQTGEETTVNLSSTEPGALGEATRFRAEWGDGTTTPWQEGPTLNHTYEEDGDITARFWVANGNQTASTTQTFHVGQEAPTEPNWISERFEEDNQDMTFGVIGIALALGGGVITAGRRYRKRSNLEDELETLETGFEEMGDQPSECEAFLDTRKARARSLALDGYLREDQVPVIENRAEELRGQLRTSALEGEFAFLPYGLVTKARQMVEDGDVSALEKDAFLRAVEEDEVLTEEQKATVRERIQRWHGRDAGGEG